MLESTEGSFNENEKRYESQHTLYQLLLRIELHSCRKKNEYTCQPMTIAKELDFFINRNDSSAVNWGIVVYRKLQAGVVWSQLCKTLEPIIHIKITLSCTSYSH